MANRKPLTLSLAGKKDFVVLNRILFMLVLLSATLSPQPIALTILAVLFIGAGCVSSILCFSNVNSVELSLVVFADGQVKLNSSCGNVVEGFLDGQQWCTRRITVLRITTGSKTQNLVVLPGQQSPDEYRRLNVWLRQGAALLLKSEGRV